MDVLHGEPGRQKESANQDELMNPLDAVAHLR